MTTRKKSVGTGLWGSLRASAVVFGKAPEAGPADAVLAATVIALVAFGVVMVYGASAVFADRVYDNGQYFLVRQTVFAVLGFFVMMFAARFDYHHFRRLTYPILGVAVVLLVVVALGLGRSAGGSSRWIQIGSINIQPSEVAKLALILWLAYSLSKKRDRIRSFSVGFLPHALMAGLLMGLCLLQPDFGSAVMIALLTFVLLFTAGAKIGYLMGAVLAAAPVAYGLVASSPYRMRRIKAFLAPFEHRHDEGYQISESLISFGSGGLTGVGIGDSRQKLFFLPEAHTDFISAIVGEELGFIGIVVLILAFVVLVARGLRIAFRAQDDYGTYLAVGTTMFVGFQAFTNLAVAMGMLPTKGLVLPFVSYGGSALLVNCAAVGILLNVSRERSQGPSHVPEKRPERTRNNPTKRRPSMPGNPIGAR
ncbi:MAG: putative lipid II flippase FtsW [Myxococcales bacterium]|nr:putative lipid II flippase FtsW [Myxococcales bacterium]